MPVQLGPHGQDCLRCERSRWSCGAVPQRVNLRPWDISTLCLILFIWLSLMTPATRIHIHTQTHRHTHRDTHTQTQTHTDTDTHTCSEQSLRIRLWSASYVQKTPTIKWQDEYTYKYRRIITVEVDHIKQQRWNICPPQLRLICAQGRDNIYIYIESRYVFTGTQGVSSLATDPQGPQWPPAT